MASFGSVLTFLAMFSVLIIAHEMGHFWVARRCGMKVERFGFGLPFGPTLWRKSIGGVEYCIHAFLVGGYVAFPDDNPDSPIPANSLERFENQPLLSRFLVAIAGITVNAILGWGIMVFVYMHWGMADPSPNVTIYQTTSREAPAYKAGIQEGDIVQAVEHQPISGTDPIDRVKNVSKRISAHPSQPIVITLLRHEQAGDAGKVLDVSVTPDSKGHIGVQIAPGEGKLTPVSNPIEASQLSCRFLSGFIVENFKALGKLATGQINHDELAGPLRIIQKGGETIHKYGMQKGLVFIAIISTILAVMNLLPIPGLDGGHILFIGIEAVKGSPLSRNIQEKVTQVGFAGLMVLMVFILGNDFVNIFQETVSKFR